MNICFILPNNKKLLFNFINRNKRKNDVIKLFNLTNNQNLSNILNEIIINSNFDYYVIINSNFNKTILYNIYENLPNIYYKNNILGFNKKYFINETVNLNFNEYILNLYNKITYNNIKPINFNKKISIIIPFMYNGDRWNLFESCITNLNNLIKNDKNIELVIHETGKKAFLTKSFIKKFNLKYEFTKWNNVFHRAWSLNYAAKNIATGDLFVFMDADLIVDKQWIYQIKKCDNISIGWSKMINLNKKGTDKLLNNKIYDINDSDIERIREPSIYAAAGGINIYPKKIFFKEKGWCEDYFGTYGGEDNSTYLKFKTFDYKIDIIDSKVFHLYHSHTTFKDPKRIKIFRKHKEFTKKMWKNYIDDISIWGEIPTYTILPKKLNILWCKIDTSKRVAGHYDDIITELKKIHDVHILTQPLQNLHPAIFQEKCLSFKIKRKQIVEKHLQNNNYDFIICADFFAFNNENWNNINIPKAVLFEDQHNLNNEIQIKEILKNKWLILHRYKFKKFFTDLTRKIKCIWFPHSVNINIFKDYNLSKKYDILQTGALYKVYKVRNFVKTNLKNDSRYTLIPRPKENLDKPYPVRNDYAKLLNQSYINICCGSIYNYPIMKFFEIPACKSVILSDWFDELGDLGFEPYKNILTIDITNLKNQIDFLLSNKKKLTQIAENGYDLIHQKHTNKIRANDLIKIIKEEIICQHQYHKH